MYDVEIKTVPGYIGILDFTETTKIRTVSIMSSRILLTDEHDHMYNIGPGSIKEMIIRPVKEGD